MFLIVTLLDSVKQGGHLDQHLKNIRFSPLHPPASPNSVMKSQAQPAMKQTVVAVMKTKLAPVMKAKTVVMKTKASSSSSGSCSSECLPKHVFARCKKEFGKIGRKRSGRIYVMSLS